MHADVFLARLGRAINIFYLRSSASICG